MNRDGAEPYYQRDIRVARWLSRTFLFTGAICLLLVFKADPWFKTLLIVFTVILLVLSLAWQLMAHHMLMERRSPGHDDGDDEERGEETDLDPMYH